MQKVLEDAGCSDTAGKAEIRQPLPNDEDYEEGLRSLPGARNLPQTEGLCAAVLVTLWGSRDSAGVPPAWRCLIPHHPS